MSGLCCGLDIGYGNLKLVYGHHAGQEVTKILPVGAGRRSDLPRGLTGEEFRQGYRVNIDGEEWVAGVVPSAFENHVRVNNSRYVTSPQYKALFLAALTEMGAKEIDCLVTGLPVNQWQEGEERKAEVIRVMQGEHYIGENQKVVVHNVKVVAQPVGAYFDALATHPQLARSRDTNLLVIDPGHGTVDWSTISKHGLVGAFSGTSKNATSVILDRAAEAFSRMHGHRTPPSRLEEAYRSNRYTISIAGEEVTFKPQLETAAKLVAEGVLQEIANNLRTAPFDMDAVVLCGGAASLFEPAIRDHFKSKLFPPKNPVSANARGFFLSAHAQMKKRQAA